MSGASPARSVTDKQRTPPEQATAGQTDPQFDAALQKTQRERSRVDGNPQRVRGNEIPHQVKPGETLYGISKEYRAPFSDVLKANRQFRDPDRIKPGDVAFVPNADPRVVTARDQVAAAHRAEENVASLERLARDPNSTPAARKLASIELESARGEVSRRWGDIQRSVENELREAGRNTALPDVATRPALDEIRGRSDDPKYQDTVESARATVEKEWRQTGTTQSELSGLVGDAQAADRSVASLEATAHDPNATPGGRSPTNKELQEARNAAGTAWGNVETELEGQFRLIGTGKPYPEEAVRAQLDELKRNLPDDPKLRETIEAAYRNVTEDWRKQGWTRDTLGTVVDKYGALAQAQREIDAARNAGPVGQARLAGLEQHLETQRTALREEIERQLDRVAGQVPPQQREMAIGARAALIQEHGPEDAAFKAIVDEATYNKTVQPAVDIVRNAYQAGDAKAAAEALRQQTENVSPETAERIVAASLPTIGSVAADMKRSLTEGGPIPYQDVAGVYKNIATATDYAARGNDGAEVTRQVADIMVRHLPSEKFQPHFQDSPAYPLPAYQEAVMQSVSDGTGATLALEMATQLKNARRTGEADSLLSATQVGVELLKGRIEDDVKAFGDATAEVSRLRADWSGTMSPEQLDRATVEYVASRPDLLPNFDRTYNAVDGLGYGAVRTSMALNNALPRLQGLPTTERLTETRNEFVASKETQFAMGLSDKGSKEVLRIVLGQEAGTLSPSASPNSSVSSTRGFVKELGNALMTSQPSSSSAVVDRGAGTTAAIPSAGTTASNTVRDIFGTGQDVKLDPKKASVFLGSMNGLGAAFNGYQAALAWDKFAKDPGHLLNMTKAVYYSIGTGKETAELLAVGAQRGWLGLGTIPGADRFSTSILAKANRTGLALEPGWVKFSTYFKIGGGLIDSAFAIDAAARGDWIASGLYTTSAGGGFLMAAGSVASSGGWLATWGGPVGAGLVLASAIGLYFYNDAKDKARFEGPSREFLEAAGYRPEIAAALSDYSNNDGGSAGPALAATAKQFGVTPEQLMERLNRMDPAKVRELVDQAHTVDQDESGRFQLTAPNDRNVWAPPGKDPAFGGSYLYDPQDHRFRGEYRPVPGSWYPARMEDPNPRSMTALRDYARVLFGEAILN
ncbi:LysM peptidoglycan-binding domain-containing protein [Bradyrhizobium sp. WSM 1738]|uniref:LysM peptidoglycan-binding domain-containing protein n=1 Tax=Bradyrhizobium hereditatis TaxID=2821405 RepID=UPI001CE2F6D7|nr:LysM peptidoglycan-binding domain-containing protein [Bradyrhizobium hereditatis]MCA6116479.1 LysM peptidoglycan-binding domain-containing protein [Bradyrhizobium hereditatis]